MPRGQPDYGIYTQTEMPAGIADPGEAAARLGSINVYDRRGWTVWMDDFEAPVLRWLATCSVGGTLPVLSTTRAWGGAQSAYFVTAAVAFRWAQLEYLFPLVRRGRVGMEFWVYLSTTAPNYLELDLYINDGANISTAELLLDFAAKTATIITPAGNIVVATNCFNAAIYNIWTPTKLVVDTDTDRYVRLIIGPDEIDLSAHHLVPGGATTDRLLWTAIRLNGGVAGVGSAYVDNFILTQAEP
jgi:hypothetical protein